MYKIIACLAAFGLASPAMAATLELRALAFGIDAVNAVDETAGTVLEAGATFDADIVTGTTPGFGTSPYEVLGAGNFETLSFFSVNDTLGSTGPFTATLLLANDTQVLEFLWGTPDFAGIAGSLTNSIEVFSDGVSLGTLDLTDLVPAFMPPRDTTLTRIVSDMMFDEVRFSSTRNSFELANISTTAVPVPGAFVLMAGGLALAGMRKRKAA
ncbi:MAG: hypothetical protein AAGH41_11465 [Pseudomonadota bacterium]